MSAANCLEFNRISGEFYVENACEVFSAPEDISLVVFYGKKKAGEGRL
jgi:hypothetical protein